MTQWAQRLRGWIDRWGQWKQPPEFRIELGPDAGDATISDLLQTLLAARLEAVPPELERTHGVNGQVTDAIDGPSPPVSPETPADGAKDFGAIDDQFAAALSNGYFRLVRNLAQLSEPEADSPSVRAIQRALKNLGKTLAERQIECIDPTGEPFDAGRLDIEIIGEPEVREGITGMVVDLTERPIVLLNGKLIQRARSIILKPL